MSGKSSLGILFLCLLMPVIGVGCGSNVKKPPPPAPVQPASPRPAPTQVPPRPAPAQGAYGSAERIVSVALREHAMWYRPFIDSNGRLASVRVSEAEQSLLADGTEAWQRVLGYWRDSGTLYEMVQSNIPGAYACQFPSGFAQGKAECRMFIVDNAWSAAFVSYVMQQAHVTGFRASPRHFDYIRQAYRSDMGYSPYLYADPATQKPMPGDLLCFVRGSGSVPGYEGLTAWLGSHAGGSLATHCDIVVARGRELQTIGGNVFNGVTMRKLKLDPQGYVVLPRPVVMSYAGDEYGDIGAGCSPDNENACSFNRQNWAVLLKLKSAVVYPSQTATGIPTTPSPMMQQPAATLPATAPPQTQPPATTPMTFPRVVPPRAATPPVSPPPAAPLPATQSPATPPPVTFPHVVPQPATPPPPPAYAPPSPSTPMPGQTESPPQPDPAPPTDD